jgi:hypothetical protein
MMMHGLAKFKFSGNLSASSWGSDYIYFESECMDSMSNLNKRAPRVVGLCETREVIKPPPFQQEFSET